MEKIPDTYKYDFNLASRICDNYRALYSRKTDKNMESDKITEEIIEAKDNESMDEFEDQIIDMESDKITEEIVEAKDNESMDAFEDQIIDLASNLHKKKQLFKNISD